MTDDEKMEGAVSEIGEAQTTLESIEDDLRNAESSETIADLRANLETAIAGVDSLRIKLKAALAASRGRHAG